MANAEGVDLPYVDEHAIRIAAPREVVWAALQRYVGGLGLGASSALTRVFATEPASGFAAAETDPPERLRLAGRHRYADYSLVFELAEVAAGATQLRAQTYAAFPGPLGRIYRTLVIGSRGHVVAVKHMLRSVRRLSMTGPRGSA